MTELKAGRELDALVATEFFGWTEVRLTPVRGFIGLNPVTAGLQTTYDRAHHRLQRSQNVPRYSTDLSRISAFLDRLETLFGFATLTLSNRHDGAWVANVNGFGDCEGVSPTEAISFAALKAADHHSTPETPASTSVTEKE